MNTIKRLTAGWILASALALSGCCHTRTASLPPGDPVGLLISRPDAEQARTCAPEWVRQALHLLEAQGARIKELELAKP
jgi:hypothetical protein